eukprot:gene4017-2863_t
MFGLSCNNVFQRPMNTSSPAVVIVGKRLNESLSYTISVSVSTTDGRFDSKSISVDVAPNNFVGALIMMIVCVGVYLYRLDEVEDEKSMLQQTWPPVVEHSDVLEHMKHGFYRLVFRDYHKWSAKDKKGGGRHDAHRPSDKLLARESSYFMRSMSFLDVGERHSEAENTKKILDSIRLVDQDEVQRYIVKFEDEAAEDGSLKQTFSGLLHLAMKFHSRNKANADDNDTSLLWGRCESVTEELELLRKQLSKHLKQNQESVVTAMRMSGAEQEAWFNLRQARTLAVDSWFGVQRERFALPRALLRSLWASGFGDGGDESSREDWRWIARTKEALLAIRDEQRSLEETLDKLDRRRDAHDRDVDRDVVSLTSAQDSETRLRHPGDRRRHQPRRTKDETRKRLPQNTFRVVQVVSPTVRVAQMLKVAKAEADAAMEQGSLWSEDAAEASVTIYDLLAHLDDVDVQTFTSHTQQRRAWVKYGVMGSLLVLVPIALMMGGEQFADVLLDVCMPSLSSAFLLANYLLQQARRGDAALTALYVFVGVFLLWRVLLLPWAQRRLLESRLDAAFFTVQQEQPTPRDVYELRLRQQQHRVYSPWRRWLSWCLGTSYSLRPPQRPARFSSSLSFFFPPRVAPGASASASQFLSPARSRYARSKAQRPRRLPRADPVWLFEFLVYLHPQSWLRDAQEKQQTQQRAWGLQNLPWECRPSIVELPVGSMTTATYAASPAKSPLKSPGLAPDAPFASPLKSPLKSPLTKSPGRASVLLLEANAWLDLRSQPLPGGGGGVGGRDVSRRSSRGFVSALSVWRQGSGSHKGVAPLALDVDVDADVPPPLSRSASQWSRSQSLVLARQPSTTFRAQIQDFPAEVTALLYSAATASSLANYLPTAAALANAEAAAALDGDMQRLLNVRRGRRLQRWVAAYEARAARRVAAQRHVVAAAIDQPDADHDDAAIVDDGAAAATRYARDFGGAARNAMFVEEMLVCVLRWYARVAWPVARTRDAWLAREAWLQDAVGATRAALTSVSCDMTTTPPAVTIAAAACVAPAQFAGDTVRRLQLVTLTQTLLTLLTTGRIVPCRALDGHRDGRVAPRCAALVAHFAELCRAQQSPRSVSLEVFVAWFWFVCAWFVNHRDRDVDGDGEDDGGGDAAFLPPQPTLSLRDVELGRLASSSSGGAGSADSAVDDVRPLRTSPVLDDDLEAPPPSLQPPLASPPTQPQPGQWLVDVLVDPLLALWQSPRQQAPPPPTPPPPPASPPMSPSAAPLTSPPLRRLVARSVTPPSAPAAASPPSSPSSPGPRRR